MKLSLCCSSLLLATSATTISTTTAFAPQWNNKKTTTTTSSSQLFYDIQRDPPDDNVWSVLATTEQWIASTLQDAQHAAAVRGAGNPISRKEVSYVCETSQDPAMILANIFRKLKEARQLGERHSQVQEDQIDEQENHSRVTLRQTQVLVIPANTELMDFKVFNGLVNAINHARRNARDYVTDVSLDKLDERINGDGDRDWCVSVNCAHLHPDFGAKTPEQQLKELKEEEENGEIDMNLQEYKARRLAARRSPYPSVVVEVTAMPPPDFSPPPPSGPQTPNTIEDVEPALSSDFIQSLEELFSKSSLEHEKTKKDGGFYDSIGSQIEEVSAVTPMSIAQSWICQNDPQFEATTSAFTVSDTAHVDEAYEFVFTNLAMQTAQFLARSSAESGAQERQYLVMPNFVTSSATSMEKFAMEVENIIQALPAVRDKVSVSCLHPEHIQEAQRCSVPVFVLHWQG